MRRQCEDTQGNCSVTGKAEIGMTHLQDKGWSQTTRGRGRGMKWICSQSSEKGPTQPTLTLDFSSLEVTEHMSMVEANQLWYSSSRKWIYGHSITVGQRNQSWSQPRLKRNLRRRVKEVMAIMKPQILKQRLWLSCCPLLYQCLVQAWHAINIFWNK